jgi:hypothetical protein
MPNDDGSRLYRVRWEIEIEAETPLAAAKQARPRLMQLGANTCEVAEITPYAMNLYGKPVTIDLATENS